MPELPDLTVVAEELERRIAGRTVADNDECPRQVDAKRHRGSQQPVAVQFVARTHHGDRHQTRNAAVGLLRLIFF